MVFFVTHGFYQQELATALFLRAERQPDGRRTFRVVEGQPLPTSYGEDSCRRIFGVPRAGADLEVVGQRAGSAGAGPAP